MSISQILERLFGKIYPVGETYEDTKRYDNIQNYYEALSFIISKLQDASEFKDDNRASCSDIGQECFDILYEYNLIDKEDE